MNFKGYEELKRLSKPETDMTEAERRKMIIKEKERQVNEIHRRYYQNISVKIEDQFPLTKVNYHRMDPRFKSIVSESHIHLELQMEIF